MNIESCDNEVMESIRQAAELSKTARFDMDDLKVTLAEQKEIVDKKQEIFEGDKNDEQDLIDQLEALTVSDKVE